MTLIGGKTQMSIQSFTRRRKANSRLSAVLLTTMIVVAEASFGSSIASAQSKARAHRIVTPVTIEVYPQTYTSWLPVIAQASGFFAKNGLKAKIVQVAGGGPMAMDALANGSADIAMADMSITGPLLDKGISLQVVSGAAAADWCLVGPTSSSTNYPSDVTQFNGKTVGVIVVGGSGYYFMKALAGVNSINVTYSAFGAPVANAVAAMSAHQVDGAIVNPDVAAYMQRNKIGKILYNFSSAGDLSASGPPLSNLAGQPNDWMVATTSWTKSNPGAVRRFQLAMDEAQLWAQTPANLTKVINLLARTSMLPQYDSGSIAKQAVRPLLGNLVAYLPSTTPGAYQQFWITEGEFGSKVR